MPSAAIAVPDCQREIGGKLVLMTMPTIAPAVVVARSGPSRVIGPCTGLALGGQGAQVIGPFDKADHASWRVDGQTMRLHRLSHGRRRRHRQKSSFDHLPMPVSGSGVMFFE